MLTQEQIVYVELLKRDYAHLDKEALLKLFAQAQWSDAESSEALARFEGTYVPTPPSSAIPQFTAAPAWVDPPKASRYANIIFEDIVVQQPQKEEPSSKSSFSFRTPNKKVLMGIGAALTFITIPFILYFIINIR